MGFGPERIDDVRARDANMEAEALELAALDEGDLSAFGLFGVSQEEDAPTQFDTLSATPESGLRASLMRKVATRKTLLPSVLAACEHVTAARASL